MPIFHKPKPKLSQARRGNYMFYLEMKIVLKIHIMHFQFSLGLNIYNVQSSLKVVIFSLLFMTDISRFVNLRPILLDS